MSILKKSTISLSVTGLIISLLIYPPLYAEGDPSETCTSAVSLYKEGDLEGALEEARWCVTQLEQMKLGQISAYFKDEINSYKGGKLEQQEVMGFLIIERSYSKNGSDIKVSLSGSASGAASNAFAALASLGMAGTGKKVRIQRRTGMLDNQNGEVRLGITLKSGGILNFESRDVSADEVVAFAKEFPVKDLDDSRK